MYKLYNDIDTFNAEHSIKQSNASIALDHGINTRIRLIAWCDNLKTYKADKSGFEFSIRTVNNK